MCFNDSRNIYAIANTWPVTYIYAATACPFQGGDYVALSILLFLLCALAATV